METYKNLSGSAGVTAYEIGRDFIVVQFDNGEMHTYTYESTGYDTVEKMKELARNGEGLGRFIESEIGDRASNNPADEVD